MAVREMGTLLAFIFALSDALIDFEARLLSVGHRERLADLRRVHSRYDAADFLFAKWAGLAGCPVQGLLQLKAATADFAISLAKFIHIYGHEGIVSHFPPPVICGIAATLG